jgi:hypothetical protein
VRETLDHQVAAVCAAHRRREAEVARLLRGHALAAGDDDAVFASELPVETARRLVAREHEFRDWADATAHGDDIVDPVFEAAVDAVINGDLAALRVMLHRRPDLARARSAFGHRCTLLHYVAANGVEPTRQRSPRNAPAIAQELLDAGAEPDADSGSYGGTCVTTLDLLVSSCHPGEAGVQADLVDVLCKAGADPNGLHDDGSPLWTAITWGYDEAAERLVARGARIDNVIAAAGAGTLDQVKSYFGPDGRLIPIIELRGARHFSHGRPLDLGHALEHALICACGRRRSDIVEFLLTKEPDLDFREPIYSNTAIEAASYPHPAAGRPHGSPEIVVLLRAEMARRRKG